MTKNDFSKVFLFSVDLEDVRLGVVNGEKYKDRVRKNTTTYLDWLRKNGAKCTFFVTGYVAKNHPSLISEIIQEGHEIACHTNWHMTLDSYSAESFRKDIEENLNALMVAGARNIIGFRAPSYSLTYETQWVYKELSSLGFTYSSSVLPAKNPLFGWESFGHLPKKILDNFIEIPITVSRIGPLTIPPAGGIYFRAIPGKIIRRMIKNRPAGNYPVIGYFHPYDIDTEQERFMHGGINNNRFYNWLMYYNRHSVFIKLDKIMKLGYKIMPYRDFVNQIVL